MQTINIQRLQLTTQHLKQAIHKTGVSFSTNQLAFIKEKISEFLNNRPQLLISNKHSAKTDDKITTLTISTQHIMIKETTSIKLQSTIFSFEKNSLFYNEREIDISFLYPFIQKLDHITSNLENNMYQEITS